MNDTNISVVIPAYQAAAYIADSLISALDQDPPALEIIVVDDGSTDGTGDLARSFGPRVTVISQPNGGEASARNAGLRAASGDWVAYLDADDRFLPGRLREVCDFIAEDPAVDIVTTNGFVESNGEVAGLCYGPDWSFAERDQAVEILRRNFVFGHVIVRRKVLIELGGFDETITHTTDWEMWIRAIHHGSRVALIDRPLSIYRVHTGSLSANRVAMADGALASLSAARRSQPTSWSFVKEWESSVAQYTAMAERERLVESLVNGSDTTRACADAVRRNQQQPWRSRLKAALASIAPPMFKWLEQRRMRGFAVGTMGRFVATPDADGDVAGTNDHGVVARDEARTHDVALVTVVVAFLNEERFLDGCVETVRNQSHGTWELLLIDDGSTDSSGAIADRWASDDRRIRVLRHSGRRNQGLVASRNLGISAARAGLVAFLDADDRWQPDKLERQVLEFARHPDVAMVCGPSWYRTPDGASTLVPVCARAPFVMGVGEFARWLLANRLVPPPPSGVMYRASALETVRGVPEGEPVYEDQRTFVAVSLRHRVFVGHEPLTSYAVRPDSMYGSVLDDPYNKGLQRQRFRRWVNSYARQQGPQGWRVMATLATQRLREKWSAARGRLVP